MRTATWRPSDDQAFAAGWEFNLDTEATITDSSPVTGEGEEGFAWFELELSQTAGATISEDLQDGYELLDAFCVDRALRESAAMSRIRAAERVTSSGSSTATPSASTSNLTPCRLLLRRLARPRGQRGWRDRDPGDHAAADRHVR